MGRIYYLLGKSATGKDTLYKEILKRRPKLRTVTMYTTRPIREGETDGVEYFFTDREELERQLASGKVIESRTYQTIAGPWTYYTVDDGQFNVADDESCLMKDGPGLYRGPGRDPASQGRQTRGKPEKAELPGSLPEIPCRRKRFFRGKSGTPGSYKEISEYGYGNLRGRNPKGFG